MKRRRKVCGVCGGRPQVLRPKDESLLCRPCFLKVFESEVHETIHSENLFGQRISTPESSFPTRPRVRRICIGLSGGKDSTVLTRVLHTLNERHSYGLELQLVCVDEGLVGYRDECLRSVREIAASLSLPLTIVSFASLFEGWTMDRIVASVGLSTGTACSFCGVFRRKALSLASENLGCDVVATGHNADDLAETVLMNFFRGDLPRLERCVRVSGGERVKPLNYMYEKEIVLYAHYLSLPYFSTECKYYVGAFRSVARDLLKDLERVRPRCIFDIIRGANEIVFSDGGEGGGGCEGGGDVHGQRKKRKAAPVLRKCEICGDVCSQRECRACVLLRKLKEGEGLVGIYEFGGKISRGRRKKILERTRVALEAQDDSCCAKAEAEAVVEVEAEAEEEGEGES